MGYCKNHKQYVLIVRELLKPVKVGSIFNNKDLSNKIVYIGIAKNELTRLRLRIHEAMKAIYLRKVKGANFIFRDTIVKFDNVISLGIFKSSIKLLSKKMNNKLYGHNCKFKSFKNSRKLNRRK